MYIADTLNHRIRKVDLKTGTISTIAGTGQAGFSGDGGPAIRASLTLSDFCEPCAGGLALDNAGNLFIADGGNHRLDSVCPIVRE